MEALGPAVSRIEGHVHTLVAWTAGTAHAASQIVRYVAALGLLFALAYLCLAREKLLLRIAVFAGVVLTPIILVLLFGTTC